MEPEVAWLGRCTRLGGPVLAAPSTAVLDPFAVQSAADNVVANTRQVFHAAATNQDHRVLLQVMAYTANVGGNFHTVGQPDPGNLAKGRVGFFRSHGPDLNTHAPPLGATRTPLHPVAQRVLHPVQRRGLSLLPDWPASLSNKLAYSRHRKSPPCNWTAAKNSTKREFKCQLEIICFCYPDYQIAKQNLTLLCFPVASGSEKGQHPRGA